MKIRRTLIFQIHFLYAEIVQNDAHGVAQRAAFSEFDYYARFSTYLSSVERKKKSLPLTSINSGINFLSLVQHLKMPTIGKVRLDLVYGYFRADADV